MEMLYHVPTKVSFEEGVGVMIDHIDYWRRAPVWDEESIAEATEDWFRYLGGEDQGEMTR